MTLSEKFERIRALIPLARAKAEPIGPLHAAWDDIFDGEALLLGRETLARGTLDEVADRVIKSLSPVEVSKG